jgi:uncharacterized protein YdbL (DUF1318 family)
MKGLVVSLAVSILLLGCARVNVGGSKEPIKLDIAMRLDVYQHVEKDIDAIENIVSGPKETDREKLGNQQSFLGFSVKYAYAEEGLSPDVEQAALRRKARLDEIYALERKGVIGENKNGLLELRAPSQGSASIKSLIESENKDRILICEKVAAKNNITVDELNKVYAKRLQSDAPVGTPVETFNSESGSFQWKIKE